MTIDQVRDAVNADQVRRLVEAAPSADELRTAIGDGLDAIGEGLETVASQLGREAPTRRAPWLPLAIAAVVAAVVVALLASRVDRQRWATLRDRAIGVARRDSRSVTEIEVGIGVGAPDEDPDRELHVIKIESEEPVLSDEAAMASTVAAHP